MFNTLVTADTYLATRVNGADLAADSSLGSYLTTAYNRIYYSGNWSIPASPTAAQLTILRMAECEWALYLYFHIEDEDLRKGIQAQATIEAGVVKEKYLAEMLADLPVPPFVADLLSDFKSAQYIYPANIDRDEDENI